MSTERAAVLFTARDLAAAAVAVAHVEQVDDVADRMMRDLIADGIAWVGVNAFYAAYKQQIGTRRAVAALRLAIQVGPVWA